MYRLMTRNIVCQPSGGGWQPGKYKAKTTHSNYSLIWAIIVAGFVIMSSQKHLNVFCSPDDLTDDVPIYIQMYLLRFYLPLENILAIFSIWCDFTKLSWQWYIRPLSDILFLKTDGPSKRSNSRDKRRLWHSINQIFHFFFF